jgi:hypothetical protein
MSNNFLNYLFFLSLCGFVLLSILSILAFANVESLKIKKDNHINSGIMLLVNGLIYFGIAAFIYFYKLRNTKRGGGYM